MKMRASSVFKGVYMNFEESYVKRIWLDFCGFSKEMFYRCFTLWPKCFTLSDIWDKIALENN